MYCTVDKAYKITSPFLAYNNYKSAFLLHCDTHCDQFGYCNENIDILYALCNEKYHINEMVKLNETLHKNIMCKDKKYYYVLFLNIPRF